MAQSRHRPGSQVGTAQGDRGLRSGVGAGAEQCARALQPGSRTQRRRQRPACRIVAACRDPTSACLSRRVCRACRRAGKPGEERRSHRCVVHSPGAGSRPSGLPAEPWIVAAEIRPARRSRDRVANRVPATGLVRSGHARIGQRAARQGEAGRSLRIAGVDPAGRSRLRRGRQYAAAHALCSGTICCRRQSSTNKRRSAPAFSAVCRILSLPLATCGRRRES